HYWLFLRLGLHRYRKLFESCVANVALDCLGHGAQDGERCACLLRLTRCGPEQLNGCDVEGCGGRKVQLYCLSRGERLHEQLLKIGRTCDIDVARKVEHSGSVLLIVS